MHESWRSYPGPLILDLIRYYYVANFINAHIFTLSFPLYHLTVAVCITRIRSNKDTPSTYPQCYFLNSPNKKDYTRIYIPASP